METIPTKKPEIKPSPGIQPFPSLPPEIIPKPDKKNPGTPIPEREPIRKPEIKPSKI